MYREKLRKLIIMGVIGCVIGFILGVVAFPDSGFWEHCALGFYLSCLPYGWHIVGKIIGRWIVVGHIAIMLFAFILRFVAAVFVGWIAYPISLVYHIVMVCKKPVENCA